MYDRENENALGWGSFFMFSLEREGVKDYQNLLHHDVLCKQVMPVQK